MEDDEVQRPHSNSGASSYSDVELMFADTCLYEDDEGSALSDTEPGDNEDFDYYQDVYRFVSVMKNEFEKLKPKVDWDAIQRKREEVQEVVKTSKEKIKMKGKEKLDAGKERIAKLQRKTVKRLNKLRPAENYRLKLIFTKSVLTLVIKTFATCSGQWLIPWYYTFTCPTLILWRTVTYWQLGWQYFCLDFCYFGNLVIFLILWFAPSSPGFCALLFSLANGMLYLGSFSFRNSLVFHSVDKMTSTYIHTVPIILSFGIRWFPQETSRYWHSSFPSSEDNEPSLYWNVLAPFLVVIFHTVCYTLLVNVILRPEEHIVTSYRYLRDRSGVKKIFGPNAPYILFVFMNFLFCLIFSSLTLLTYTYYYAHVLAMSIQLVFIIWNGAGYYVDIFRMSMIRKATDKKEK